MGVDPLDIGWPAGQSGDMTDESGPESDILDIGEVVLRSGVVVSTLHVWEREGLIEPCGRLGLRRQYTSDVLDRIAAIVLCQRSGFSLAEIRRILAPDAFADGKAILEEKLAQLKELADTIATAIVGIEHSIACSATSPMECPGFRSYFAEVLPISAQEPSSVTDIHGR